MVVQGGGYNHAPLARSARVGLQGSRDSIGGEPAMATDRLPAGFR